MVPTNFRDVMLTPGIIEAWDPPLTISGMVRVELDPQGRLIYLEAIPPELETPATTPVDSLRLEDSVYRSRPGPVSASANPANMEFAGGADSRTAWTCKWPTTNWPLRVEAASWRGQPVFFSLVGEWRNSSVPKETSVHEEKRFYSIAGVILLLWMMSAAILLARRNYRLGRSDTDGATRLGLRDVCVGNVAMVVSQPYCSRAGNIFSFAAGCQHRAADFRNHMVTVSRG